MTLQKTTKFQIKNLKMWLAIGQVLPSLSSLCDTAESEFKLSTRIPPRNQSHFRKYLIMSIKGPDGLV